MLENQLLSDYLDEGLDRLCTAEPGENQWLASNNNNSMGTSHCSTFASPTVALNLHSNPLETQCDYSSLRSVSLEKPECSDLFVDEAVLDDCKEMSIIWNKDKECEVFDDEAVLDDCKEMSIIWNKDKECEVFDDEAVLDDCKEMNVLGNEDTDYGLAEELQFSSTAEFLDHVEGHFEGLPGRIALYSIPGVIEFVESILYSCSMAQERRRSDELQSVGISIPDLREVIFSQFPEVRQQFPHLGDSTVRRLGMAPHKSRKAAKYYHCIIHMKNFRIENNRFLFTTHAHSAFAQVNLIFEQCAYFQSMGDTITMFSSDVSQVFNVGGTTMTSRYACQLFFQFSLLDITKIAKSLYKML
jgi:hypothetical protein